MTSLETEAAAYNGSRLRIDALTRDLDDRALATMVPCCPKWSVKDLVGHLTGLLEDRRDGRMPTGDFHGWTNDQVVRHRDESISTVLDTWLSIVPAQNDDSPDLVTIAFDAVTHEHDLFHALGVAGDRGSDSVILGAQRATMRTGTVLSEAGAPGIEVTTEDGTNLAEGGAPPIGLKTSRYEMFRLATGRMSRRQATALDWDGDPDPVLDALFASGFFKLQPMDVVEVEAH